MSQAYQRGIVLFQQSRYDLAARELRQALAEEPDHPLAHAFLALCLAQEKSHAEALREADEGVRLAPDTPFCHYVRGHVLVDQDRLKDAEASAREAIRLDPEDADYPCLLARIELARGHWTEALDAANRGLALDPSHDACRNFRALALVQLGRKDEASQTLGSALADDPTNAWTHANQGWTLLHKGDPKQALEHFREALRIDPNLEWARLGIIEALKARHLIYRGMLAFFLWMGRQSQAAQWAVILGFVLGRRALAGVAQSNPALAPFIMPVLILTFGFLIMTWIASPLFNFLLRFNKFGRLALSKEERFESSVIGSCFVIAAVSFVASLFTEAAWADVFVIYFGLLLLPLAMTFKQPAGNPRRLSAAYTAVVFALGLPLLSLAVLGPFSPFAHKQDTAFDCFLYFRWGAILATWIPAVLGRS
jgi:tetratricopeptide (TPR) repeat protein